MELPSCPTSPDDDSGKRSRQLSLVEAELADKEEKLMQAAMYGKTLLEENASLRTRVDTIMKQHAAELEDKQQELCTLTSRLEVAGCTQKWQAEEMASLRAELSSLKDKMEEERRIESAVHKKQISGLHQEVDHLQSVEQSLRSQVTDLESLLQSHLDRTVVQNTSASFTSSSEELAALQEELGSVKITLTESEAKNIELCSQLQECQRHKEAVTSRLRAANEEMEELQCESMSYARHLEEARREVLELRAQLDASRTDNQGHCSKGNSVFSELEDRRLVLEKKMSSLKIQNQQLVEKYSMEKEQNNNYRMQIAQALQITSSKDDSSAQRLREQLREAHAQIRTLIDKMQELEASKGDLVPAGEEGGDQFFMATLQLEKNKAMKAEKELQAKSLQYLDVSQQNVHLSHQNRQLTTERDSLRSQVLKLTAQREELITKFEPDKAKESKTQKKVTEIIDLGDQHLQHLDSSQLSASSRLSHIFKPCPTTGRTSAIFRPSQQPSARLSNIFKPSVTPSGVSNMSGRPSEAFKKSDVLKASRISPETSMSRRFEMSGEKSHVLQPVNAEKTSTDVSDVSTKTKKEVAHVSPLQKENYDDDTFTLDTDPSFSLPATGRSVKMSDDVNVIYADGEVSMEALAEEKSSAESLKKKQKTGKQPAAARNVKYIHADEAPELDCKTQ